MADNRAYLPYGWHEKKSGRGKMYYFNVYNGESSWHRPALVSKKELAKQQHDVEKDLHYKRSRGELPRQLRGQEPKVKKKPKIDYRKNFRVKKKSSATSSANTSLSSTHHSRQPSSKPKPKTKRREPSPVKVDDVELPDSDYSAPSPPAEDSPVKTPKKLKTDVVQSKEPKASPKSPTQSQAVSSTVQDTSIQPLSQIIPDVPPLEKAVELLSTIPTESSLQPLPASLSLTESSDGGNASPIKQQSTPTMGGILAGVRKYPPEDKEDTSAELDIPYSPTMPSIDLSAVRPLITSPPFSL